MTISKEVRIGLLVAAALVIFFAGFYFLRGSDIFSNDKDYYVYFESVEGLQKATQVQIKGLAVGRVSDMKLDKDKGVKVVISVNNNTAIPAGTVASLAQADLLGTKIIRLDLGDGPGLAAPGSTLEGHKDGGALDKISGELSPRLEELKGTISAFNLALANVNSLVGEENQRAVTNAIKSLKATSDNLAHLTEAIDKESGQIGSIIRNTNSITSNLARSNDTVQRILSNTSKLTGQLANAPIQKTVSDLQKTTAQLQEVMDKINHGKGSMGMLVNDKDLYNNLNKSVKSLNNLTDDLKAHPGRYIHISVFGGNKKD